jgi:hypothetical protein
LKISGKIKLLLIVIILTGANITCFDMYNQILDNMPDNYRLSIFVNGVNANRLFLNDKDGNYYESTGIYPDDGSTNSASILADFDKDGNVDILIGDSSGWIKTYINNGNSLTAGPAVFIGSNITDFAAADFDNDKYIEVIAVTYGGPHFLLQIDKNFNIFQSNISGGNYNSYAVSSGDIDHDGDIDIYIGNSLANNTVWLNNGDGTFINVWNDGQSRNTVDIALVDLDDNGTLDVLEANEAYGITVRKNTGNGTFNLFDNYPTASLDFSGISSGDIDNDGDMDAFVTKNLGTNKNIFLKNNGSGSFIIIDSPSPIVISNSSAMGDLDNDGDIDVVEVTDGGLHLLKNDGYGNFNLKMLPTSGFNIGRLGVIIK